MQILNETHDPALRSWVASANQDQTDFPLQNLPFAVFRRQGSTEAYRGGVAIGDQILDLAAVAARGVLSAPWTFSSKSCCKPRPCASKTRPLHA